MVKATERINQRLTMRKELNALKLHDTAKDTQVYITQQRYKTAGKKLNSLNGIIQQRTLTAI